MDSFVPLPLASLHEMLVNGCGLLLFTREPDRCVSLSLFFFFKVVQLSCCVLDESFHSMEQLFLVFLVFLRIILSINLMDFFFVDESLRSFQRFARAARKHSARRFYPTICNQIYRRLN